MDKNMEFPNFQGYPNYIPFDIGNEPDPMFNPMIQYEQGYIYYRYLCKQMEYKIKCKEYEKLCNTKGDRKIEWLHFSFST